MRRFAFTMKLKPGFESEYERRHNEIWPELSKLLLFAGVVDYSIFLDPKTLTLFAYQEVTDDFDDSTLPHQPIMKKWWTHMADIMETNPDDSPRTEELTEVFHMEGDK
ncbi:MAG: L-rhamnose mutarotase [Saprospiraceae bacterium]|nr:L-rhamnose mutarotase [Saprospiraceae bacterium]